MKKIIYFSLLFSSVLFGAAYQIPMNSINSFALAGANVANANGSDAAYFNPANMVYNDNQHEVEGALTFISVNSVHYASSNGTYNIDSKSDNVVIPSFHYVSNRLTDNGLRVGFSIVAPAGLSREWTSFPALPAAEKYALETIEFNPSIAIAITKELSIGFGLSYMIATTDITLNGRMLPHSPPTSLNYNVNIQDAKADALAYNLALTYKPTKKLTLATTYRASVNLDFDGAAHAEVNGTVLPTNVSVTAPIPDSLVFAGAYKFNEETTLEALLQITMWSRIKEQNFNYSNPTAEAYLGNPTTKRWRDTYAYRLGLTHQFDKKLTLMAGIAYETDPAEEKYVSYTTAQADSMTYALGARYSINNKFDIGLSAIYVAFDDRTATQSSPVGVNGTLSNKGGYGITTGVSYKF